MQSRIIKVLRERIASRLSRGKLDLVFRLRAPEGAAGLQVDTLDREQADAAGAEVPLSGDLLDVLEVEEAVGLAGQVHGHYVVPIV